MTVLKKEFVMIVGNATAAVSLLNKRFVRIGVHRERSLLASSTRRLAGFAFNVSWMFPSSRSVAARV
jgi:hypothetical protein